LVLWSSEGGGLWWGKSAKELRSLKSIVGEGERVKVFRWVGNRDGGGDDSGLVLSGWGLGGGVVCFAEKCGAEM